LARKGPGKESKLSYSGNLLVENRNGLIVDAEVFQANGTAERDAALIMLEKLLVGNRSRVRRAGLCERVPKSAGDAAPGAKSEATGR
jgi:hypothetical protein